MDLLKRGEESMQYTECNIQNKVYRHNIIRPSAIIDAFNCEHYISGV